VKVGHIREDAPGDAFSARSTGKAGVFGDAMSIAMGLMSVNRDKRRNVERIYSLLSMERLENDR
jgi:hypothetical protein